MRAACPPEPAPSSSAAASSATASPTTSRGWAGPTSCSLDKGPLPNPGGSTGHASNFIFPVDHSKEMTALTVESSRQYRELRRLHRVRRHRDRPHRGADGGAAAPDGVGEVVGHRAGLARDAGRDQAAGAVHRRVDHPRRLLLPDRRRRRLAARGHDDARGRAGAGRALRVPEDRGARHRRGARPGATAAHDPRRHRGSRRW